MSELSERTVDAIIGIQVFLKVGEWDFLPNDAGKLVVTLSKDGNVEEMTQHVFMTVVRSEKNQCCKSLRELLHGKKFPISDNGLEFSIPLPVKLADKDKVRFWFLDHKGKPIIAQFNVCLK